MDIDSSDGDAWLLDALSTSLLFSAASPSQWPCGDPHSSLPMDSAAVDDAPGTRSGKSESTCKKVENINGNCQVHVSLDDDYSDSSYFLKERLTLALRYFKECTNQHLLVQVWAPIKNGDRYVLTTSGQPFVLDQQSIRLLQYRAVSMMYVFSIDGDNVHELGLPGRVYKQRVPEWTPNVQYYTSTEYSRLNHAINFNVHGTVALPVFDPSAQSCIAVVELIMTSKKINYASEVDKVCRALEAVNLKSTEIVEHPYVQICNEGRQAALVEILEILTVVCEELKLPLAQTWVPCKYQSLLAHGGGVKSCLSFDGSCMEEVCMSTSDVSFYVIDARMWGFRDACVVHHLQKGQGVSGKALILRRPCFSKDVSRFSKMEYPLVHYARMFGLAGCFSICLQSAYTGNDDYILEFFLPTDCRKDDEQKALLESILVLLRQHLHNLWVTRDEGSNEVYLQVDAVTVIDDEAIKNTYVQDLNFQGGIYALHESDMHRVIHESDVRNNKASTVSNSKCDDKPMAKPNGVGTSDSSLLYKSNKHPKRRRGKAEKTISLEVLQQYFSGSLKTAAKSLGVCPTTMKRICRKHGISHWPSRQISKVNRSISNLKKVIESVEGSEGAFNLTSITGPLPVPVCPSNPLKIEKARQNKAAELSNPSGQENRGSSSQKSLENGGNPSMLISHQTCQADKATNSRSLSGERSTNSQASEGSCHGSLGNRTFVCTPMAWTFIEPQQNLCNPEGLTKDPFKEQDLLHPRRFIKDSGSSKDSKNQITSAADEPTVVPPGSLMSVQNPGIVTVKACYKEDILRFRFPCSGSVIALKDEVAKRIQMDVGVFDIKYLDDDHEWVKLTCDADLEECIEISRLCGSNVMRLLVTGIAVILGSSCGSTG